MSDRRSQNPKLNVFKRIVDRFKIKFKSSRRATPSSAENTSTNNVSSSGPSIALTDVRAIQLNAPAAGAVEVVGLAPAVLPAITVSGPPENASQPTAAPQAPPAIVPETTAAPAGTVRTSLVSTDVHVAVQSTAPAAAGASGQVTNSSAPPADMGDSGPTENVAQVAPANSPASSANPATVSASPPQVSSVPKRLVPKGIAENAFFQSAKTAISVLKGVLDDVPAHGLKTAINGVDVILQTLQKADQNSEDFQAFGDVTTQLLNLISGYKDQRGLPEPLGSQIDVLAKQIDTIQAPLQKKFARGRLLRVAAGSDDATEIIQMFRNIAAKIQTFLVACNLQMIKLGKHKYHSRQTAQS
ncbi:hypothetical protein PLICRDRAFT_172906 [Plicaturopsis crispa FD-325 SS-3]|nr:hypothetical protein PLICRDRAFT_172906 [Plicaturopsis crispa FD-325 SS-3]